MELPDDNFPFLVLASLQPGCPIVKIGATTSNTIGQFLNIASVEYSAKPPGSNDCEPITVRNAVLVQWEPGQRFTAEGDSGCVYYAKLGSFYHPIAVHRGQVVYRTRGCLNGGEEMRQIVSFGSPLQKIVDVIKDAYDTEKIDFFKHRKF